jgi:hypothetical protein
VTGAPAHCTVAWKEVKEGEEARKQRTYNGAERSIAQRWFSVNVSGFVRCI